LKRESVVFEVVSIGTDVAAKLVGAVAFADENAARGDAPDVFQLDAGHVDGGSPAGEVAAVEVDDWIAVGGGS
jgi:hypothetical protein